MDEVTHTILPNNGIGGNALSAGFGGLIGSWLGNGFGGFGGFNRGAAAGIGYDTGAINALQGQLNNISGQISNADRDLLMQTSQQNQFVGNLVNSTGDAIVGAINSAAMNTQQGIYSNTLNQVQSQGATNLAMCQGFGGINSSIDRGVGLLNMNISNQGAESRLQAQQLASQQQSCCCQVLQKIEQEGCASRELQREIQAQNIRDQLAASQAENAALKSQLFATNAMAAQTATIINALKPATTTAGA
ncbi:MAG: hypothetical protein IIW54_05575 [Lachnospiraceae bacterium]|nr:hypothetical protein [Lachnospiraceae bacterium]